MRQMDVFDQAELKARLRRDYHDIGELDSLQVVYELIIVTKTMLEVIKEERLNGEEERLES